MTDVQGAVSFFVTEVPHDGRGKTTGKPGISTISSALAVKRIFTFYIIRRIIGLQLPLQWKWFERNQIDRKLRCYNMSVAIIEKSDFTVTAACETVRNSTSVAICYFLLFRAPVRVTFSPSADQYKTPAILRGLGQRPYCGVTLPFTAGF